MTGALIASHIAAQAFPQTAAPTTTLVTGGTTSHLVTMPPLVNAGDLLLVLLSNWTKFGVGSAVCAPPSGWTELWDGAAAGAGPPNRVTAQGYAKVAAGTEDGGTVDFVTDRIAYGVAQCYRVTRWYGSLSGVAVGALTEASAATNPNPPNLAPGWGARSILWIAVTHHGGATNSINSYPTNYINGVHTLMGPITDAGEPDGYASVSSARRELFGTSQDPGNFQQTAAGANVTQTIAIRPLGG